MANNNGVGGTTSNRQPGGVFDNQSVADARGVIPQGTPGATGAQGPTGPRGPIGPMGTPGTNGTSITGITDDDTAMENGVAGNRLTINLSDGTSRSVFLPFGQDGDAGRSITGVTQNPPNPTAGQSSVLTITFSSGDPVMVTLPAGAMGTPGDPGDPGNDGDNYRYITLYQNLPANTGPTNIAFPGNNVGFNTTNGNPATSGNWGPQATPPGDGEITWFTSATVRQIEGANDWASVPVHVVGRNTFAWSIPSPYSGEDGTDGTPGAQGDSVTNVVFSENAATRELSVQTTVGTAPNATTFNSGPFALPADTTYTFEDGTAGSYEVTPLGGSAQTVETLNAAQRMVVNNLPFTQTESDKLGLINIDSVVDISTTSPLQTRFPALTASERAAGLRKYLAIAISTSGAVDPANSVSWTTGGGGSGPATETLDIRLSSNGRLTTAPAQEITITFRAMPNPPFFVTGYRNLRLVNASGASEDLGTVPTEGTTTTVDIPARFTNDMGAGVHTFIVDVLSEDRSDPANPVTQPASEERATYTISAPPAASRDVFYGYAAQGTRTQALDYSSTAIINQPTDTNVVARDGNTFNVRPSTNATGFSDLVLIMPTGLEVTFLGGEFVPNEPAVTINNLEQGLTGYVGMRFYNVTGRATYTIIQT